LTVPQGKRHYQPKREKKEDNVDSTGSLLAPSLNKGRFPTGVIKLAKICYILLYCIHSFHNAEKDKVVSLHVQRERTDSDVHAIYSQL